MKTYRLTREQFIALPPEEVFDFFADAHNLELLTPPWLRFEIITPGPIEMRIGTEIESRLKLRGVPVKWRSEITVWQPPYRFVDMQRKGPYRLWIHTHSFQRIGDGTLVTDMVDYAVPGGDLVQKYLVGPDLERIFDYRARQLDAWVLRKLRNRLDEVEGNGNGVTPLHAKQAARGANPA